MINDYISRDEAIGIFTQLWDCIGTIMDRDEWEDACRTTANELPSADVVSRSQLIETIKHYAQYPDGIHKLLAVYAERRTDE